LVGCADRGCAAPAVGRAFSAAPIAAALIVAALIAAVLVAAAALIAAAPIVLGAGLCAADGVFRRLGRVAPMMPGAGLFAPLMVVFAVWVGLLR
jgi:hypothetical protein